MSEPSVPPMPTAGDLSARLGGVLLRDEPRLRRRLDGVRKIRDAGRRQAALASVERDLVAAEERLARRVTPTVTYPEQLPVSQRRDEIADAVRDHQVVIVAGET